MQFRIDFECCVQFCICTVARCGDCEWRARGRSVHIAPLCYCRFKRSKSEDDDDDDSNISTEPSQPSQPSSCFPLSEVLLAAHHPHPDTPIIGSGRAKALGYRWLADITLRALFQRILYKWKRLNT